jgi:flagellar hook-associated protein 1 FlgK
VANFAAPVAPATVAIASEGISINFTAGAAVNGDSFKLMPARGAGSSIARIVDDVKEIAAAFPVSALTVAGNTGAGVLKSIAMTNTATAAFTTTAGALTPPLRIVFTSAVAYEVRNLTTNALIATGAFTPNADNNLLVQAVPAQNAVMGYDITMAGAPVTGDQFTLNYNSGGIGDNRNMQMLAVLQNLQTMDNGSSSFSQGYGRLIANVGTRTHEAEVSLESSQTLMRQADARKQSISGVNLDEEAANLLRFQQAYEASAQVVSVANSMFDVLFQSIR